MVGCAVLAASLAGCAGTPPDETGALPEDYREIAFSLTLWRHFFFGFDADDWQISAPFHTETVAYSRTPEDGLMEAWGVCMRRIPAHGRAPGGDLIAYRGGDFYRYVDDSQACTDTALTYVPLTGPG